MEKRRLGKTGLDLSVLGFGGFHLVEIDAAEAARLLGAYLDAGGNYVETAASYGDGISETKIGRAVSHRRGDFFLATKSTQRTRQGFSAELDQSLRNLRTDHVDVVFIHALQKREEADQVLASGGALEAAAEAKNSGKARFVAVSFHGRPDAGLYALERFPFDVLMTGFNYFDRFNYPGIEGTLLPMCIEKGVGVLAMKSLADGYLYRSAEPALRYTLSLPVTTVVAGINSQAMLETDLRIISSFTPMGEKEKEDLPAGGTGWTIGSLLGHIAFWDRRALLILRKWKAVGIGTSAMDVDVANDTMRPFLAAVPARIIKELALESAQAIDEEIDSLDPGMLARVEANGTPKLDRAGHRAHHLEQIEKAMG